MNNKVQHVFFVGAKSLGAYGGYETFVNKLTEYHRDNEKLKYYVACKANGDGCMDENQLEGVKKISDNEFVYNNAYCFKISIPEKLGPAQAIYYDLMAIKKCCKIIKNNKIEKPIIYIMACRIGLFIKRYYKKVHKLGGQIYINPDGHEWKRAKWNAAIRKYWKYSEKKMVEHSDLVVCDSINIEEYIHDSYDKNKSVKTVFIPYGAETRKSIIKDNDEIFTLWLDKKGIRPNMYYLVVGRFVPENNYETMIREFMRSQTTKDFVLITNVNDKFLDELERRLHFKNDSRIKFVGTVYNQELLMKIRENAYGYLHGHEVGGTNPSLLEALGSTKMNLLLKVGFNEEVAGNAALYWTKEESNLSKLIDYADGLSAEVNLEYEQRAKARIIQDYSWEKISSKYYECFIGD